MEIQISKNEHIPKTLISVKAQNLREELDKMVSIINEKMHPYIKAKVDEYSICKSVPPCLFSFGDTVRDDIDTVYDILKSNGFNVIKNI